MAPSSPSSMVGSGFMVTSGISLVTAGVVSRRRCHHWWLVGVVDRFGLWRLIRFVMAGDWVCDPR